MPVCESFVIRLVGDEPSSLLDLPRLRARLFCDRRAVTELLTDDIGATSVQINDDRPVRQGEDSAFGVGVVVHATTLFDFAVRLMPQHPCRSDDRQKTAGLTRVNAW